MRVYELIEKLQKCPPNDIVISCNNDDCIVSHIEDVRFGGKGDTPDGITVLEDYPDN